MYQVKRAKAGLGLFATCRFKSGDRIIQYKGERVALADTRDNAKYLMSFDDTTVIDGKARDNTARYINHSCKPNAEAIVDGEVFIYARRSIKPGEEITIHYGREYWETFIGPDACKCTPCSSDSRVD